MEGGSGRAIGGGSKRALATATGVLIALIAIFVWLLNGRLAAGHVAQAPGDATLSKDPQTTVLFIGGGDQVVAETVADIPEGAGLGAFNITLFFNNRILDVSVSEGPFLSSTGRTTRCFYFPFESFVRFSCVSMGSQPGPTGSGVLAFVSIHPKSGLQLRPTQNNGVITILDNSSAEAVLSDPLGEDIAVGQVLDGVVFVRALEGDLNKDCTVDVIDEQMISYRYNAVFGSLLYGPPSGFFDLEPPIAPDGEIDIKDLQFV